MIHPLFFWQKLGRAALARDTPQVLHRVDPEQHEVRRVRYPAEGLEDGCMLRRQHDCHPGDVQARG